MLAEFQERGAKLVFEFDAVEIHGDVDGGDGIFAVEDAMGFANVQELDGEDVGGARELFFGEEERGGFALIGDPPLDDRGDAAQVGGGEGAEDDQDVDVGVFFVEVAAGGGAVEDYGVEIGGGEFFEAVDEFG